MTKEIRAGVDRPQLLQILNSVKAGLSTRDVVEQSTCFVFREGKVYTYNDEVSCSHEVPGLEKVEGAVTAPPLLAILQKMSEDEVRVSADNGELVIRGKHKKAGITLEKEVFLPLQNLEEPRKWKELPGVFGEALELVASCAAEDQSLTKLICVHFHPSWLESCDNFQACRYDVVMPIKRPFLIRKKTIEPVIELGVTEISETENWVHFRNSTGLVVSCRRYAEEYPDISALLVVEGKPIALPKGLKKTTEKAEVFTKENPEEAQLVQVRLGNGKIRVKAQGQTGWYEEFKNVKYAGKDLTFCIAPKMLRALLEQNNTARITQERMSVDGGAYKYVSVLGTVGEPQANQEDD